MEISTMPTDNVTDTQFNCTCPPQGRMISFNWDYAQTREDQDLSQFADNLAYARKLKFGHLYRCQGCDSWWFLGEEPGAMMCYVPPTSRQSLEDWNASNLIPDNRQIASLKEIGGSGADTYGNGQGSLRIPCQITWSDGTIDDPCLVIISKNPPQSGLGNVGQIKARLFRDVYSIRPTRFALPPEIRIATLNAYELSMGYSPTCVESSTGRRFVLNWANELFQYANINGMDLKLSLSDFSNDPDLNDGKIPVLCNASLLMTYVYCDWFDGCQALALS